MTTRRELEDATRRRFGSGLAGECKVEGCDRPGMALDTDDDFHIICFMHMLMRIDLIASFVAQASVPSKVLPQRTCELCDQPAIKVIVMDMREWNIETGLGGGGQWEWPVCDDHTSAYPMFVTDEPGIQHVELVAMNR